jgi:hypothetical protein
MRCARHDRHASHCGLHRYEAERLRPEGRDVIGRARHPAPRRKRCEAGRNGLLFPNGDVRALSAALSDIAAGRAFPDRTVPASAIREVAQRHEVQRHVARIEEIRDEIAGTANGRCAKLDS